MRRHLLLPLLLLPLLLRAQVPAIDGYRGLPWLTTSEAALAQLGKDAVLTQVPETLLVSGLGSSFVEFGTSPQITLTEVVGGRTYAVKLQFTDNQLVVIERRTPVRPGETFAQALAAVRRTQDPALPFKPVRESPPNIHAAGKVGYIELGREYVVYGKPRDTTQVLWHSACWEVDHLMAAYHDKLSRQREQLLRLRADPAGVREGNPSLAAVPGVKSELPAPATPKIRRPTPAQRRRQAARRAWWRRTLPKAKPARLIFCPDGMIRPRPTFPARTPNRFA